MPRAARRLSSRHSHASTDYRSIASDAIRSMRGERDHREQFYGALNEALNTVVDHGLPARTFVNAGRVILRALGSPNVDGQARGLRWRRGEMSTLETLLHAWNMGARPEWIPAMIWAMRNDVVLPSHFLTDTFIILRSNYAGLLQVPNMGLCDLFEAILPHVTPHQWDLLDDPLDWIRLVQFAYAAGGRPHLASMAIDKYHELTGRELPRGLYQPRVPAGVPAGEPFL